MCGDRERGVEMGGGEAGPSLMGGEKGREALSLSRFIVSPD